MVPHSIFSVGSVLEPLKNAQTGILFSPPPIFSVFINPRRNMFRDCGEEYAPGTVLIDTNDDLPYMKAIMETRGLKLTASIYFYQRTAHMFSSYFFWKRTGNCWGATPIYHSAASIIPKTPPPCTTILFVIYDPPPALTNFSELLPFTSLETIFLV